MEISTAALLRGTIVASHPIRSPQPWMGSGSCLPRRPAEATEAVAQRRVLCAVLLLPARPPVLHQRAEPFAEDVHHRGGVAGVGWGFFRRPNPGLPRDGQGGGWENTKHQRWKTTTVKSCSGGPKCIFFSKEPQALQGIFFGHFLKGFL